MLDIFSNDRPLRGNELPVSDTLRFSDPSNYILSPELESAVNVALSLQQPLLVTGEPGTGKTLLGHHIAWRLGLEPAFFFSAKSDSLAQDLYYRFDTLARFHDAQDRQRLSSGALSYVSLQALGLALAITLPTDAVPVDLAIPTGGGRPRRSVVIVDEIDKAPRDVPNDILHDLESMQFRIHEAGLTITGDRSLLPFVVFTSNSERSLPDAFLRRCIFHHIYAPAHDELQRIILSRFGWFARGRSRFVDECIEVYQRLREPSTGLRKLPATAELIAWLRILVMQGAHPDASLFSVSNWEQYCATTLAKTLEDFEVMRRALAEYRARRP
jgi:MoxR-like ATPase